MRGLSLLLAVTGAIAGFLVWRGLATLIPADPAAASMAVRLGLGAAYMLPACGLLAAMILAQMTARSRHGCQLQRQRRRLRLGADGLADLMPGILGREIRRRKARRLQLSDQRGF